MRSVQNFITIAARHGKDMRPFLMRSVGRNPQRLAAQNAAERAFSRSSVPSRSGNRVMGLDGLTGNYTGPAVHPAGEPHRPTQWGPEQAPCTSGDRKHGGEQTLPREGDDVGVLMVSLASLVAQLNSPVLCAGDVTTTETPSKHQHRGVISDHPC